MENKAQNLNERLTLYRQILMSEPHYFLLNQKEYFISYKSVIFKDTKDIILSGSWLLQNTPMMKNLEETFQLLSKQGAGKLPLYKN